MKANFRKILVCLALAVSCIKGYGQTGNEDENRFLVSIEYPSHLVDEAHYNLTEGVCLELFAENNGYYYLCFGRNRPEAYGYYFYAVHHVYEIPKHFYFFKGL